MFKRKITNYILFFLTLLILVGNNAYAEDEIKIRQVGQAEIISQDLLRQGMDFDKFNIRAGVVNMQRIYRGANVASSIARSTNLMINSLQDEMANKKSALKKEELALINKRGTIPDEEFARELSLFNQQVNTLQQEMRQKKAKLEKNNKESMAKVHAKILQIITQLAKEHNLNFVTSTAPVLYFNQGLDLTDNIIDILNKTEVEITPSENAN